MAAWRDVEQAESQFADRVRRLFDAVPRDRTRMMAGYSPGGTRAPDRLLAD
jgi:hypothetical protein